MIVDRIERFISDPQSDEFGELAIEAFCFQYERIEAYRRLCQRRGADPASVTEWRQVPPVPALAFKTMELATATATAVFRSSGTTGSARSVHQHGFTGLYRATIDAAFPRACLGRRDRLPLLSLIATFEQAPDSSLSFMIDHAIRTWGTADSLVAFGPHGVEAAKARSFLAARQRDHRPTIILSTALALVHLLEALERSDLRFRLPAGTMVFETGGYKGRRRHVERTELVTKIKTRLGVPAEAVVREYGMTELTSQFYTSSLQGGDPEVFVPPHWTRVRMLDVATLQELPAGRPGLICVFDLANLSSAVHLLTEDLGRADEGGFRLVGRAAGSELRGCSLAVEELAEGPA